VVKFCGEAEHLPCLSCKFTLILWNRQIILFSWLRDGSGMWRLCSGLRNLAGRRLRPKGRQVQLSEVDSG